MPHAIPYIDAGVRIVSIPPHTHWGPVIRRVKNRLRSFSTNRFVATSDYTPNFPKARLREDWWITGDIPEETFKRLK